MILAQWGTDYDWRNDKLYKRPMHLECDAPILMNDSKYVCVGCGEEAKLDGKMLAWLEERQGEKVEEGEYCISCGKNDMAIHYHKNYRTKKWEVGYGECKSCGCRFIV